MKNIAMLLLLIQACGHINTAHNSDSLNKNANYISMKNKCDSCNNSERKRESHIWYSEIDSCGNLLITRGDKIDSIKSIDVAIQYLNMLNEVKITRYNRDSDSVLYIKIVNSDLYTQRMGSAGASMYMLSAIYTLTDHFGYEKIYFDFQEGDSGGQPGLRDRKKPDVQLPDKICK